MTFDEAREVILDLLRRQGKAKNSQMLDLLGGDQELLDKVREDLVFEGLAEDKKGVGLIYVGPAEPAPLIPEPPAPAAVPLPSPTKPAPAAPPTSPPVPRGQIFLSYARGDDEPFVRRLYEDLSARGFDVWFDRVSMPARQLTFHQEIRDAVAACDRLLLVVGPKAVTSDYVAQEWRFAYFEADKCVNPIVRLDGATPAGEKIDGYDLIPEDLKLLHAEDFRDDARYAQHLENLVRQLSEEPPRVGKLVAVPELPPHFHQQRDRIKALRDMLLVDLQGPVVVTGAAARVGVQGMGGIGKSVLACALARRPEVRRAFPDGVFWVAIGQDPDLAALQRGLATELGDEALLDTTTQGRETLRKLLDERAALLVLDDVWRRDHAEAFNVIGPRGRVLLTTRDTGLVTALAARENHYQVELPTMAEAEALLAAAAEMKIADLPREGRQVIAECGRLPLGLALCGGLVAGGVPWADLLEALREHDLEYLSTDHPPEEHQKNIWRAMDVSIRALPEAQRDRFAELAVFALDTGAPEAAVETLWAHTAALSPRHARKLLADFARRSLIQQTRGPFGEAQGGDRVTLHDLLHNFATGMANKRFGSSAELHTRLLEAYRNRCPEGWPSGPNDGYFFEHLREHLLSAGQTDQLAELLQELPWLEAKTRAGLVFELAADFTAAVAALPEDRPQRRILKLLLRAITKRPAWIRSHPGAVFQMCFNHLSSCDDDTGPVRDFRRKLSSEAARIAGPWFREVVSAASPVQTLAAHSGPVHAVVPLQDGRIASASDDAVVIWDPVTGRFEFLEPPCHGTLSLAVLSDGRLACGSQWRVVVRRLEGGDDERLERAYPAQYIAVLNDGRLVMGPNSTPTAAFFGRVRVRDLDAVRVWDLEADRVLTLSDYSPETVHARGCRIAMDCGRDVLVWTPQDHDAITEEERQVFASNQWLQDSERLWWSKLPEGSTWARLEQDERVCAVWKLEAPELMRLARPSGGYISSVVNLRDGCLAWGDGDGNVMVWDADSNSVVGMPEGGDARVYPMAASDQSRVVFACGYGMERVDGRYPVTAWNAVTNEIKEVREHTSFVSALAVLDDGKVLSGSYDGTAILWDPDSGDVVEMPERHSGMITCLAELPGGRIVTGSEDSRVKLWDARQPRRGARNRWHRWKVESIVTRPDGRTISVDADGEFVLIDRSGNRAFVPEAMNLAVKRVSGDRCVPTDQQGESADRPKQWNRTAKLLSDGRVVWQDAWPTKRHLLTQIECTTWLWSPGAKEATELHGAGFEDLLLIAALPDGGLVSGSRGVLRIWRDGKVVETFSDCEQHGRLRQLECLADGRVVFIQEDDLHHSVLRVWNPQGHRVWEIGAGKECSLANVGMMSEQRIITWHGGNLRLWDPSQGRASRLPTFYNDGSEAASAFASIDEDRVLVGLNDGWVKCWEPVWDHMDFLGISSEGRIEKLGKDPRVIRDEGIPSPHSCRVLLMASLGNGRVVSADEDGLVHLWDFASMTTHSYQGDSGVTCASFCADVCRLAAGFHDGNVLVVDVELGPPSPTPTTHG